MRKDKKLFFILLKMAIPNLLILNTHDDMSCDISYKVGETTSHVHCTIEEYEMVANHRGKSFSGFLDQLILNT